MTVELLQFRFSNAAEKVRWALEYKGIAHRRRDLLPGLHRAKVKRLTKQTATPVLLLDDARICGSAEITAALERRFPESKPLYPTDPTLRAQALDLERHFDRLLGPAVRIAILGAVLDDARYAAELLASGSPPTTRALYRAVLPFLRGPMRSASGIDHPYATRLAAHQLEQSAVSLARLAKRSFYLCGDGFSVADLTAAALLAPLVAPHPQMRPPEPMPDALAALVEKWRSAPVGAWVLEMYRRHRPVNPS